MNNIQLVVFDIAGTTVRDRGDVADAFIAAFRAADVEIPVDEVKKVMGWRKMDAIRQLLDRFLPVVSFDRESLIEEIHDRFIKHMTSFYRQDPELRPLPHAEEIICFMKRSCISSIRDS